MSSKKTPKTVTSSGWENSSRIFQPVREKKSFEIDPEVARIPEEFQEYLIEKHNLEPNINGIVEEMIINAANSHSDFTKWRNMRSKKNLKDGAPESSTKPGKTGTGSGLDLSDQETNDVLKNLGSNQSAQAA